MQLTVLIAVVVAALVVGAGLGINRTFVSPRVDRPLDRAGAIVVLGGEPYERFEYGLKLAAEGLSDEVVLSNSVGAQDERMGRLCSREIPGVRIRCFVPHPWTTRGEAYEIRKLAQQNHWDDLIVITTTAHVERARYILGRCTNARLQVTDYPEHRSVSESIYGWIYQSGAWLKALSQSGC